MKLGDEFGRLTVVGDVEKTKVLCECKCGTVKPFYKANLRNGRSRSCGCLFREIASRSIREYNERIRPTDSPGVQE